MTHHRHPPLAEPVWPPYVTKTSSSERPDGKRSTVVVEIRVCLAVQIGMAKAN